MNVILLGYVAVVILWVTVFFFWQKTHRATWWLLLASVLIALAWFLDKLWLSLLGMLAALTAVSFIFQVFTDWLKKKQVSRISVLIWFEWLLVFSITLAHLLVWAMQTLRNYSV